MIVKAVVLLCRAIHLSLTATAPAAWCRARVVIDIVRCAQLPHLADRKSL
jgi:hypothetical protein